MKICKFCRKSGLLKKRDVTLPTGLVVTSIDPMCKVCYDKLKSQEFKLETNLETNDNISGESDIREVEGTSEPAPTVEGQ